MTGSRPGYPGPYSCALAALNRARSRYEAVARVFNPSYHQTLGEPAMSQDRHYAAMRQLQWRRDWIKYGEEIIREYQHRPLSPFDTRDDPGRNIPARRS